MTSTALTVTTNNDQRLNSMTETREMRKMRLIRQPAVVLVENLHTRMGISIVLSFAFTLEDSQALLRRLCRRGEAFLERDEGQLAAFCVSEPKRRNSNSPTHGRNTNLLQKQKQIS